MLQVFIVWHLKKSCKLTLTGYCPLLFAGCPISPYCKWWTALVPIQTDNLKKQISKSTETNCMFASGRSTGTYKCKTNTKKNFSYYIVVYPMFMFYCWLVRIFLLLNLRRQPIVVQNSRMYFILSTTFGQSIFISQSSVYSSQIQWNTTSKASTVSAQLHLVEIDHYFKLHIFSSLKNTTF